MALINIQKTDAEIEKVVKAQARVRACAGAFALTVVILFDLHNRALSVQGGGWAEFVGLVYAAYNCGSLVLASRFWPFSARQLVVITAVLDPLMLSAALAVLGQIGQYIFFFYLFTTIGFGLRLGTAPMWLCQGSAIVGFSLVAAFAPNWSAHLLMATADLVLLVMVPAYATVLVKSLHSALALAKRESQAKSQLLAHVSHELRTPLTGIVSSAQLIKDDTDNFGIGGRADTILGLASELLVEISDLLDSAKYEASALVLESAPLDLHTMMEQVHHALASTAAVKQIDFRTSVDPRVVDMVLGDQHYLFRVLANIGANAVKFTDHGSVALHIGLLEEQPGAYHLSFQCRDTGIGIPLEWQPKIFTPFVQAPGGNKGRPAGTGLGMSISSQLVGLMGGTLALESEVGKGSEFHFTLKLPRVAKSSQSTAAESLPNTVYGKHIFLAEDNVTVRELLKEILERDKHVVEVACSGSEAITKLGRQQFDLLLLDYNLGDLEGIAVLAAYRLDSSCTAPAYILTADATEETAQKVRDSGALCVLHKPISRETLRRAIARAVSEGPRTSASPTRRSSLGTADGVNGGACDARTGSVQRAELANVGAGVVGAGAGAGAGVGAGAADAGVPGPDAASARASSPPACYDYSRFDRYYEPHGSHASHDLPGSCGLALPSNSRRTDMLQAESIALLTEISSEPRFLVDVITTAIVDTTRLCQQLSDAMARHDLAGVRRHAGTLRGLSLTVGASQLTRMTDSLVHLGETELQSQCDALQIEAAAVAAAGIAAMRQFLASVGGSGPS
ncbi:MAG: response regulator [Herminiimonas sp.]|nr:response regulator [Herminiimonas sp.]